MGEGEQMGEQMIVDEIGDAGSKQDHKARGARAPVGAVGAKVLARGPRAAQKKFPG